MAFPGKRAANAAGAGTAGIRENDPRQARPGTSPPPPTLTNQALTPIQILESAVRNLTDLINSGRVIWEEPEGPEYEDEDLFNTAMERYAEPLSVLYHVAVIGGEATVTGVTVVVATGGPHVAVDTQARVVRARWESYSRTFPINADRSRGILLRFSEQVVGLELKGIA